MLHFVYILRKVNNRGFAITYEHNLHNETIVCSK